MADLYPTNDMTIWDEAKTSSVDVLPAMPTSVAMSKIPLVVASAGFGYNGTLFVPLQIDPTSNRLKVDSQVTAQSQESSLASFVVTAPSTALGNNKSMLSILNASGSEVVLKLRDLKIINVQNTAVTGVNAIFQLNRITGHSVGTALTPLPYDTSDSLNGSITARTGATIAGEAAAPLHRWHWGSDEWSTGPADAESADHAFQNMFASYRHEIMNALKAITLRAGEGLSLKHVVNSTAGSFDVVMRFTQE